MERMSLGTGRLWAGLVIGLTALIAGGLGVLIGIPFGESSGLGIAFAIAGVGILYGAALYRGSVRPNEFIVVERMMRFWDVKFQGLHFAFPLIDRVRENDDFFAKDVELFVIGGDPKTRVEIDFMDGSAPVAASAWYQIGDPEAIRANNWARLREDVLKWTYMVLEDEREERITEIFEGALRPILQSKNIAEASTGSAQASNDSTESAKVGLKAFGVYPVAGKGVIIRDIELPQALVTLRELELEGQKRALQMKAASSGYWSSIQEIIDAAKKADPPINLSPDKAQEIFERQIALGVIKDAKANITFISPDIDAVTRAIIAGAKGAKP